MNADSMQINADINNEKIQYGDVVRPSLIFNLRTLPAGKYDPHHYFDFGFKFGIINLKLKSKGPMANKITSILKRVKEIEKNLQELKVDLLFHLPKKELKIYPSEDILKEIKKTRKKLWNEKYSKTI
jgi:hypothetical protein